MGIFAYVLAGIAVFMAILVLVLPTCSKPKKPPFKRYYKVDLRSYEAIRDKD